MAKSYTIRTNADGTTTTTKTNNDGSKVTSTSSSSNNSYNFKTGKYESSGSSSSRRKKSSSSGSSGSSSSSSSSSSGIDASWIGPGAANLDKNQTAAAIAGITNQEIKDNVGTKPTDNVFQETYNNAKNKYIADKTNNSNSYYKQGDIFQDSAVSKQHYVDMLNAQQMYKDSAAIGDAEGMALANEKMNEYRRLYGYQEQYANKAITDALLAKGAQWVDMRDSSGTFHDDGALVINGKAYDPRTGQQVSTGTQVWNADGTQSWVKNDIQFNGTPYINTNPTRANNVIENMIGLEQGALDLESAQTLARELGLNSLAEEQLLNDNHAAALRVLRQEALDQLTNGQIDAIIRAGEETQGQLLANLANEALSGGSEGAHAANIVTALLGNNQAITDVTQKYEEQMLAIQDQYNADIASGRIDAYERYTANIMKAKEYAQADLYNQLMAAQIFATYKAQMYSADAQVAAANATASAYNKSNLEGMLDPTTPEGVNMTDSWIEGIIRAFPKYNFTPSQIAYIRDAINNGYVPYSGEAMGYTDVLAWVSEKAGKGLWDAEDADFKALRKADTSTAIKEQSLQKQAASKTNLTNTVLNTALNVATATNPLLKTATNIGKGVSNKVDKYASILKALGL